MLFLTMFIKLFKSNWKLAVCLLNFLLLCFLFQNNKDLRVELKTKTELALITQAKLSNEVASFNKLQSLTNECNAKVDKLAASSKTLEDKLATAKQEIANQQIKTQTEIQYINSVTIDPTCKGAMSWLLPETNKILSDWNK